jgi:hypothetical protein
MGDNLLMKKFITASVLLLSIEAFATSDLKWVNEQVDAIKPSRTGISASFISELKDPIKPEKVKKVKKKNSPTIITSTTKSTRELHLKPLTLESIINKSAYINGKWYRENDQVRGKKITLISKNYVILQYKKKQTRLFINKKNDKIKITTR